MKSISPVLAAATLILGMAVSVQAAEGPLGLQTETMRESLLTPEQAEQRLKSLKKGLNKLNTGELPETEKAKVRELSSDVRIAEKKVAAASHSSPQEQKEVMHELESTLLDLEQRYAQVSNPTPTETN